MAIENAPTAPLAENPVMTEENTTPETIDQKTEDFQRGQEMINNSKEKVGKIFSSASNRFKSVLKVCGNMKNNLNMFAARTLGAGARNIETTSAAATEKGTELAGKAQRGYETFTSKANTAKEKLGNRVDAAKKEYVMSRNDKKIDARFSRIAKLEEMLEHVANNYIDQKESVIQAKIAATYESGEGIGEALDEARDFETNKYTLASEVRANFEAKLDELIQRRDALQNRIGHPIS